MKNDFRKCARGLAFAAGSMDFCTGIALVFAPVWTLNQMEITAPVPAALVYVSWVGAFVAAVGASYLFALISGSMRRLKETFGMTLLFRFSAGAYCAAAVINGGLQPRWLLVSVTDFVLVALQIWMLRGGDWNDD